MSREQVVSTWFGRVTRQDRTSHPGRLGDPVVTRTIVTIEANNRLFSLVGYRPDGRNMPPVVETGLEAMAVGRIVLVRGFRCTGTRFDTMLVTEIVRIREPRGISGKPGRSRGAGAGSIGVKPDPADSGKFRPSSSGPVAPRVNAMASRLRRDAASAPVRAAVPPPAPEAGTGAGTGKETVSC